MTRPGSLDDCQDVVEAVTDFLEGALAPADATALQEHLAECEGCEAYLAQVRLVCEGLRHLPGTGLGAAAAAGTTADRVDGDNLPAALVDALTVRFAARHPRSP